MTKNDEGEIDRLLGVLRLAYRDKYTDPNVGVEYPDYSYDIERQIKDLIPRSGYPECSASELFIGLGMAISLLIVTQTFLLVLMEITK